MSYSYNLVDQTWIPCIGLNNRTGDLSLRQAFALARHVRGIAGSSPLETAAVYRLLLAVLHSALRGPENASAWRALWQAGNWDAPWLHDYLDRWKHRFDLFDPQRPFYQAQDEHAKTKSIINVVMDITSGNNAVLFDHHTETGGATLSPPQAASLLVTVQTFGLAGLFDPQQRLTFTDAPWSRGVIFLIEGANLFETLALNLLRYDVDNARPMQAFEDDGPAWERDDPYLPKRDVPRGYLDYLTWLNRHLLLLPEGGVSDPFIRFIKVSPGLRLSYLLLDPMKHYRQDEKLGNLVLRYSEERALWRDSAALFQVHNPQSARPPLNFSEVADRLPDEKKRWLRFMCLGMANDQAKIEFFREEHFPLPLDYLESDELVGLLSDALALAEAMRSHLWQASGWLAVLIIAPKSDGLRWKDINRITKDQAKQLTAHWGVERFYWSELELPFLRLLEGLPEHAQAAMQAWKETLRHAAWNALEHAATLAGEAPTALKAAVRARSILGGALKQYFPEPEEKEMPV